MSRLGSLHPYGAESEPDPDGELRIREMRLSDGGYILCVEAVSENDVDLILDAVAASRTGQLLAALWKHCRI